MNKTFYVSELEEIDFCDQTLLLFKGSNFALPYKVKATAGNHNYKSCSGCLNNKNKIIEDLKKMRARFPNCCEGHAKLIDLKKFREEDFDNLEEATADKIMFTYHHVINHVEDDDWFGDITDYISYNIDSFGSFPTNYGSPFLLSSYYAFVKDLIKGIPANFKPEKISQRDFNKRITELLKHLAGIFEIQEKDDTDLNILLSNYDKWYRTFPFQLEYFSHLKGHYQNRIPILGDGRLNKYSGNIVVNLHTKQSLTEYLIETTVNILSKFNSLKWYEEGIINNVEKLKIDILLAERKVQLTSLRNIDNTSRTGYIKVLKLWFNGEASFLSKIEPYLRKQSPDINSRPNRTDIAIFFYYVFQTREYKNLKKPFPSDAAWAEIGNIYTKNSKNIQIAYNSICNDEEARFKKATNIQYVLENMLKPYPLSQKLAERELNMAK